MITSLISLLILALVLYLVYYFVAPLFPGKGSQILGVILGLILLAYALQRFGLL